MTRQWAGHVAVWGGCGFILQLSILHLVRADLDPSWRVVSEYAVGRHGWMMVLAFLLLAAVSAALAVGTWAAGSRRLGPVGAALLAMTAVGMGMAGIFVTDLITVAHDERTPVGRLHEVGALLDMTPFAAILVSLALLRGTPSVPPARRGLMLTMFAPLIALILFSVTTATQLPPSGIGGPEAAIGWPNRILILSYCAWYAAAGWYLGRIPRNSFPANGGDGN